MRRGAPREKEARSGSSRSSMRDEDCGARMHSMQHAAAGPSRIMRRASCMCLRMRQQPADAGADAAAAAAVQQQRSREQTAGGRMQHRSSQRSERSSAAHSAGRGCRVRRRDLSALPACRVCCCLRTPRHPPPRATGTLRRCMLAAARWRWCCATAGEEHAVASAAGREGGTAGHADGFVRHSSRAGVAHGREGFSRSGRGQHAAAYSSR